MFFYRNDLDTEAEKRGTYLSMMYNIVTSNCQCFFFIISMYTHGNEMRNELGWFLYLLLRLLSFLSDNSSSNYWRDLMIDVECARLLTSTQKWIQVGLSFVVMKVTDVIIDRE